jgi:uncharacterized protein (TIGR03118 family)
MRKLHSIIATLSVALLLGGADPAAAQFYTQHNLVSDIPGLADHTDPSLVNPWGLVASTSSPFWVSNNGTATSTLYNGTGAKVALTNLACQCVIVPGAPTGVVFNGTPFSTGTGFVVSSGGAKGPARFIFASEDGSISGWNPGVPPPVPPPPLVSSQAIVAVPPSDDNVYKGLAIASTIPGDVAGDFLYATNFRAGTVDVFDHTFAKLPPGRFGDPRIPEGYAPFGIQNIGGIIYVTYALQDEDKKDDVRGMGHGFVNAFDTSGNLIRRVASRETLNSPWGLALSPADFGTFSNDLLVGNFGDGRIHAYDPSDTLGNGEYKRRGMLHSDGGPPLEIDGLWALRFGNGGTTAPMNTLFFTAGPDDESHGLFGSIVHEKDRGKK